MRSQFYSIWVATDWYFAIQMAAFNSGIRIICVVNELHETFMFYTKFFVFVIIYNKAFYFIFIEPCIKNTHTNVLLMFGKLFFVCYEWFIIVSVLMVVMFFMI